MGLMVFILEGVEAGVDHVDAGVLGRDPGRAIELMASVMWSVLLTVTSPATTRARAPAQVSTLSPVPMPIFAPESTSIFRRG